MKYLLFSLIILASFKSNGQTDTIVWKLYSRVKYDDGTIVERYKKFISIATPDTFSILLRNWVCSGGPDCNICYPPKRHNKTTSKKKP